MDSDKEDKESQDDTVATLEDHEDKEDPEDTHEEEEEVLNDELRDVREPMETQCVETDTQDVQQVLQTEVLDGTDTSRDQDKDDINEQEQDDNVDVETIDDTREEQEVTRRVNALDDKGRQVKRSTILQGQQFVQMDVNHDEAIVLTRLMERHNPLSATQEQGSSSAGFNCFNRGYSKARKATSFIKMFGLKRGIAKFGEPGRKAAKAEMRQLHERTPFTPSHPEEMSAAERHKTLESLIFLAQKRDERIKARTCANGSVQRGWMSKEAVDAKECRCVATVDMSHAFIQTNIKDNKDGDRITMKMKGPIVNVLVELDHNLYHDKVVYDKKKRCYVYM